MDESFELNALAHQKGGHIFNILFHVQVHVRDMGNWLSLFVDDEAGALRVWELVDAFGGHHLHEFDLG